jgi:IPT/TIG domain
LIASLVALTMLPVASAWAARNGAGANAGLSIRKATSEVSATPSATKPHWACPTGPCEAIVDPPPVKLSSGYALTPNGPLFEGGGIGGGYSPADLQSAYKFPATGGSTQTIALVDAFGYAAAESDLAEYRKQYGLPACTKGSGCFKRLNQKGEEANYPKEGGAEEKGWQVESALDLDMASAACPSCHIMLVEAENAALVPDNLAKSVNTAVIAGATEVSNSYGAPEEFCASLGGECTTVASDYSHAGVVITVSAGDEGYNNNYSSNASPSFPATLPSVISVGGTFLHKAANARGWSESVWNEPGRKIGTGSGCSAIQTKPAWQTDKACTHRIDNDIAAVGGCETPVSVYMKAEGGFVLLCGTSASAPLVAGIMALASEPVRSLGARAFYESPGSVFDVTKGTNGTCSPPVEDEYFCHAEIAYDGPTGLGTPNGLPSSTVPTVTKVEPNAGPVAGGTSVAITGTNFTGATAVKFGSTAATSFKVNSATSITATSPAEAAGTVDVTVTTPEATSPPNSGDLFTYAATPTVTKLKPTAGPVAGGTTVTITGTNLTGASAVKFGSTAATSFTVNSATSITAQAPAEPVATVDVTVTTAGGTSAISSKDHYKFSPTITSLSPNAGSTAGGTTVTVKGTGFALGTTASAFKFGTTKATSANCATSTECTVVSPAHEAGKVEVKVTVNKVTSLKTAAATFTYS